MYLNQHCGENNFFVRIIEFQLISDIMTLRLREVWTTVEQDQLSNRRRRVDLQLYGYLQSDETTKRIAYSRDRKFLSKNKISFETFSVKSSYSLAIPTYEIELANSVFLDEPLHYDGAHLI